MGRISRRAAPDWDFMGKRGTDGLPAAGAQGNTAAETPGAHAEARFCGFSGAVPGSAQKKFKAKEAFSEKTVEIFAELLTKMSNFC